MGRHVQNRLEKRADYEAYERHQAEEEEDRDDEDEEEEAEVAEEIGEEEEEKEEDEEEEEAPKKKKAAAKPKAKSRSRAAKVVRMKVVWGVFNNSNARVATYEYPQRREAEEHAARLTTDKKSVHFVQPVKEPLEEKEKKET